MIRHVSLMLILVAGRGVPSLHAQGVSASGLQIATGIARHISATSVTIADGRGRETSFAVVPSTRFIGKGLSHDLVLRWPRRATDVVKRGDRVTITFRQSGDTREAVQVRVVRR